LVANDFNAQSDIFVHDSATGQTSRVSVDSAGNEAHGFSFSPEISADGRYVAFQSDAPDLVVNDFNGQSDIFVHDRQTGQTSRVSVNSANIEANGFSFEPSINADGRYVTFQSDAFNLVANDFNGLSDIFVHDRQTGQTSLVSVDSTGIEASGFSYQPSTSADGQFVAFQSDASNLISNDFNAQSDVFIHDRQTGQTTRVSVDGTGSDANGYSDWPSISADGRYVAFRSDASNLIVNDFNGQSDIFVHDRQTGQTSRVSVDSTGIEANGFSFEPSISADGRFVTFQSDAFNLVANDINGWSDIFVHDRQTGQTSRISQDSAGNGANSGSYMPAINDDGRFIAYTSDASNLVTGDLNGFPDIFVYAQELPTAPALFHDDMESGLGNWIIEGSDGNGGPALWTLSQHRFNSTANALYYGKLDTFDYQTGKPNFGSATSLPIDLTGVREAQLSFYHFLQKEDQPDYDTGRVQISIDGGVSWEDVYLASQSTDGFQMQRVEVSLSNYTGQVIHLRFSFDTLDQLYNNHEGWVIDDVSITEISTAPDALFKDDMEAGSENWIVEGDDGNGGPALWHQSTHRAHSATTAFYYGLATTLNYETGGPNTGSITSVPIDLSNVVGVNLSFQHYLRKEASIIYDTARVQVSIDGGISWVDVYIPSQDTAGSGFEKVDVNLAAYAGQYIQLRFSFETLDTVHNDAEGWVIDDVTVEAQRP
ncbi:MAG: hypothetical protein GY807_16070, partial [Gammaproteobacteria bacterium]|nr:hypothetical protein [Gammaproteobacteria bacterium]